MLLIRTEENVPGDFLVPKEEGGMRHLEEKE